MKALLLLKALLLPAVAAAAAAAVASLLLLLPLWLLLEREVLHCCASVKCVCLFVKRETVRRLA